ncbi:TPA_asm: penton [Terrapene box turtle adintovirus]|uniref:Penton n=1 Tax=Terrapene box turtle adintovirus TaxID=2597808 RepID=A0A5H3CQF9_9VIRU|nr:penton [Terrapene box turtle adintovirus]DAC80295.1 TPA_asm: penton [Terrapene box turtle adintovirus]
MSDGGFYITLPSNASSAVFPQNTISNFTIRLIKPLDLPGAWEVGLVEIQYPHSWNTINEDTPFEITFGATTWNFILRRGYYSTIPELLEHMNSNVARHPGPPEVVMNYDPVGRKVRLKSTDFMYVFSTGGELANILGLGHKRNVQKFPFSADITGGFNSLYVYTDIVEHQFVGDFSVPLLRCVPVRGRNNEFVTITYDKPHYVPVSKHHIDTITIEIKTDQNRDVSFRFGKVIVKLHLRPRRERGF